VETDGRAKADSKNSTDSLNTSHCNLHPQPTSRMTQTNPRDAVRHACRVVNNCRINWRRSSAELCWQHTWWLYWRTETGSRSDCRQKTMNVSSLTVATCIVSCVRVVLYLHILLLHSSLKLEKKPENWQFSAFVILRKRTHARTLRLWAYTLTAFFPGQPG